MLDRYFQNYDVILCISENADPDFMATDMLVFMQFMRNVLLPLPGVTEKMCFDDPAFYANKKIFANVKLKDQLVALHTLERDRWMAADPDTFFITNHYLNYKYMLVRLESVSSDDLKVLLMTAWCNRATKTQVKMHGNKTIAI